MHPENLFYWYREKEKLAWTRGQEGSSITAPAFAARAPLRNVGPKLTVTLANLNATVRKDVMGVTPTISWKDQKSYIADYPSITMLHPRPPQAILEHRWAPQIIDWPSKDTTHNYTEVNSIVHLLKRQHGWLGIMYCVCSTKDEPCCFWEKWESTKEMDTEETEKDNINHSGTPNSTIHSLNWIVSIWVSYKFKIYSSGHG